MPLTRILVNHMRQQTAQAAAAAAAGMEVAAAAGMEAAMAAGMGAVPKAVSITAHRVAATTQLRVRRRTAPGAATLGEGAQHNGVTTCGSGVHPTFLVARRHS